MIAVVDYGRGNMFSVGQALRHLGVGFTTVSEPAPLARATRVILPGVGAFGDAITALRERSLVEPLRDCARRGIPFLGICLGMQVLADFGEESAPHEGLGLIAGEVQHLPVADGPNRCRIPNVGWRRIEYRDRANPFADLIDGVMFYFNHSYGFRAADPSAVAATIAINGTAVAAVIARGNVFGFQFHPEKSGPPGLQLLRRFLDLADTRVVDARQTMAAT